MPTEKEQHMRHHHHGGKSYDGKWIYGEGNLLSEPAVIIHEHPTEGPHEHGDYYYVKLEACPGGCGWDSFDDF